MNKLEKGGSVALALIVGMSGLSGDQVQGMEKDVQPAVARATTESSENTIIENLDNGEFNVTIKKPTPTPTGTGETNPTPTPTPTPTLEPIPTPTLEPIPTPTPEIKEQGPCVVIYRGDKSKKEIAFTFDDSGANFDKILATLKENGISGTFFLLASEIRNNPERWQQAVKDGNLICSHGTSHNFSLGNQSEESIRADIQGWEDAVTEVLGADYLAKFKEETPYFRTPGGNKTERLLKVLGEMGYKYTFYWTTEDCWSMEPENNPDNLTMEQIYIFSTEPGAIFLLHPPHQSHLAEIIDGVEAKGYTFVTLGQWGFYYENQMAS